MIHITEKLVESIANGFHIPAKPELLSLLQKVEQMNVPSVKAEALIIKKDVGLSASIIKTVNSPLFGLKHKIRNIQQAVSFLGKSQVNYLVTALLFKKVFSSKPSCLSLERYWDDSSDVANSMMFIAKYLKVKAPAKDIYIIGLFHDCGIPALANKFDDYKEMLIGANTTGVNSIEVENNKYNINHAIVGYSIAKSWHLPDIVCRLILNHHNLTYLNNNSYKEEGIYFSILKLAENLVEIEKRNSESPDWKSVKQDVLKVLSINESELSDLSEEFNEYYHF
ncbi:MAG: HDOD domain-containing protein [Colwellia sp.]